MRVCPLVILLPHCFRMRHERRRVALRIRALSKVASRHAQVAINVHAPPTEPRCCRWRMWQSSGYTIRLCRAAAEGAKLVELPSTIFLWVRLPPAWPRREWRAPRAMDVHALVRMDPLSTGAARLARRPWKARRTYRLPPSTGRPCMRQAVVPPLTLTTCVMPCCCRTLAAFTLR